MKSWVVLLGAVMAVVSFPVNSFVLIPDYLKIFFYSKTTIDDGIQVYLDNINTLRNTDYDPSKKTVFIIHGWLDDHMSSVNLYVREAYLAVKDVNVFVVDWSKFSRLDLSVSRSYAAPVGRLVGQLIHNMVRYAGLDLGKTAIVGHSFGGIVAGAAGAVLGGQLDHIIGLDPVAFDKSSAKFVQNIHTSPIANAARGHADYWVNGGGPQPGCGDDPDAGCAHWRAIIYFAESVSGNITGHGNFTARQCSDYDTYLSGGCNYNAASYMGKADIDKTASGNYYLTTNSEAPYSKD